MASDQSFVEYVCDQIGRAGAIIHKKYQLDDQPWITTAIRLTADALPVPVAKKPPVGKTKKSDSYRINGAINNPPKRVV
jgi:hypothetical protein